jgi:prephenate dehydratase
MARVAFLGPHGTFTEEALLSQADLAVEELIPIRSVPEVIAAVERWEADLGIVPIENSIEGSVNVTLDTLAFESELLIQREAVLAIDLNLCARPGTELADIKTVTSHPHATAQAREWLSRKLPGVEILAANSTAEAAQFVARSRGAGQAAISTALAAKLYGLAVLATDVADHPENQTRFVVLGRGIPRRTGHDKTTLVVFQRQDRPGSLLGILQEFAARAVNLTKLESRPTKRGLGQYCFFIDCEGHLDDEVVADVLRNLAAKHTVKFLGSYPVAGAGAGAKRKAAGKAWKAAQSWIEELRAQVRADDEASGAA